MKPSHGSSTGPDTRREEYVRWRQRIADRQEEHRVGEEDAAPEVDPRWSLEALFGVEAESPPSTSADPADGGPTTAATPQVVAGGTATATATAVVTPPRPEDVNPTGWPRPVRTAGGSPRRPEVEARVRRLLIAGRSPRATSAAPRSASEAPVREGASSARSGALQASDRDDPVGRGADGIEVVRSPTDEPARHRASVGEELRALNRRRVDGELSDEEFTRRKRELFIRSSAPRRPPS